MKYKDLAFTWAGDLTSVSSYAQHARALLEPIIKGGAIVRLEPMKSNRPPADLPPWWHQALQKGVSTNPSLVLINHCEPQMARPNTLGGPNVLFACWPTTSVPVSWRPVLSSNNFAMILTSNKAALDDPFLDSTKVAKGYVPCPIELDPIPTEVADIADVKKNTFVFGAVGYWNQKNNFSDLVIAYTTEFSNQDNVALVIKTLASDFTNLGHVQEILNLVRKQKDSINKPDKPPIIILQDVFDEVAMNKIVRRFNCYVSTKRGSAVEVNLTKAIGMGKPCIVPNAGVPRVYLDDFKALPKAMRMIPVTQEPVTLFDGGYALDNWARMDVAALAKHMKQTYIDSVICDKETTAQLAKMKAKAVEVYSPEECADRLATYVRTLSPKPLLSFA